MKSFDLTAQGHMTLLHVGGKCTASVCVFFACQDEFSLIPYEFFLGQKNSIIAHPLAGAEADCLCCLLSARGLISRV